MSSYTPPYKLSQKAGKTTSKETALEGISAFLSRVEAARNEADKKEDLAMQERIIKGDVSTDELILWNKTRQKRFAKDSVEWQTLDNNVAELEIQKKWDAFSELQSSAADLNVQKQFLNDWRSDIKGESDLDVKIGLEMDRLNVKLEDKSYSDALQASSANLAKGKKSRQQHISFLYDQLRTVKDETLKERIQSEIDNEEVTLKREVEQAADYELDSLHASGLLEDENAYLAGLEEDKNQAVSENDLMEVKRRTGDIKEAKAWIYDIEKDTSFKEMKLNNEKNTLSDDERLQWYKDYLGGDSLDEMIRYGEGAGQQRKFHYENAMNKFIPDMILNKQNELSRRFDKLDFGDNGTLERMKSEMQSINSEMGAFLNRTDFINFTVDKTNFKNNLERGIINGMVDKLDEMGTSEQAREAKIFSELSNLEVMYPEMMGDSTIQNKIDTLRHNTITREMDHIDNDREKKKLTGLQALQEFDELKERHPEMMARAGFATSLTSKQKEALQDSITDINLQRERGEIEDVDALRAIDELSKYEDAFKSSEVQNDFNTVQDAIGRAGYGKFQAETEQTYSDMIEQLNVEDLKLDDLFRSRPDLGEEIIAARKELSAARERIGQGQKDWDKQYGQTGGFRDYMKFLPNLKTGKVTNPKYEFAQGTPGYGSKELGTMGKLGAKIESPDFLKHLSSSDIISSQYSQNKYLKAGVQTPWGTKIPNVAALQKYDQSEILKIGRDYWTKKDVDIRF